jgi:hypothetical protein
MESAGITKGVRVEEKSLLWRGFARGSFCLCCARGETCAALLWRSGAPFRCGLGRRSRGEDEYSPCGVWRAETQPKQSAETRWNQNSPPTITISNRERSQGRRQEGEPRPGGSISPHRGHLERRASARAAQARGREFSTLTVGTLSGERLRERRRRRGRVAPGILLRKARRHAGKGSLHAALFWRPNKFMHLHV